MQKFLRILILISILSTVLCQRNGDRVSKRMCETYKSLVAVKSYTGWCLPYQDPAECLVEKISYNCKYQFTGLIDASLGVDASLGEFPHMAAIGWKTYDGDYQFACGGSLISNKYVLTAAHCNNLNGKAPSIVRLGEQNLKTYNDGAQPVDYNIKRFIKHERYSSYHQINDIALIELEKTVTFTEFIRPACLKQNNHFPETKVVATGWGQNGTFEAATDELQKVGLDLISNFDCETEYEEEGDEKKILSNQICAGSKIGGKDTCRGDSGGPILDAHEDAPCVFDIIGITSFGKYLCGTTTPAVYTRVSAYLNWIEKKVWP